MPSATLPTLTRVEVESHNTAESCYCTIGEKVFDVTSFLEDHPGGDFLILDYAGKDVKEILKDHASHKHSQTAYDILEDNLVGFMATEPVVKAAVKTSSPSEVLPLPATEAGNEKIVAQGGENDLPSRPVFEATGMSDETDLSKDTDPSLDYKTHQFLDLSRPLLPQVWNGNFDKDFYLQQVHRPRHYKGGASAPLMPYEILEPLSKTAWWVVPMVWLPPVAYGTYISISHQSYLPLGVFYWCLGLFIWSLVEYCLHRFLFHIENALPNNRVGITGHFLLHGIHHYLPMDKYRLVMPPTLFVVLATPFWYLAHTLFFYDWYAATAVYSGGIFGYVCYDLTHYFLHHKTLPAYWRSLKKYHLQHHFADFENGFGVTSRFWDRIFNTELEFVKAIKTT